MTTCAVSARHAADEEIHVHFPLKPVAGGCIVSQTGHAFYLLNISTHAADTSSSSPIYLQTGVLSNWHAYLIGVCVMVIREDYNIIVGIAIQVKSDKTKTYIVMLVKSLLLHRDHFSPLSLSCTLD